MSRPSAPFLGPIAPWLEDEGGDLVYAHVKRDMAEALIRRLQARIDVLSGDDPSADALLCEMRRQMASSGVDGDFTAASDLAELAYDLVLTAENAKLL